MFSVKGWKVSTWRELEIGADETLQSFVLNRLIASQGIVVKGQVEENMRLTLMDYGGNRQETAVLRAAGHGTVIGSLGGLRLVLDFSGQLVEFNWKSGTHDLTSPSIKPWGGIYQTGAVLATVDLQNQNALFRRSHPEGERTYTLVPLSEVYAQEKTPPIGQFTINESGEVFQGMGSYETQVFRAVGGRDSGQRLYSYDATTGKRLWVEDISYLKTPNQEPEGLFVSKAGVVAGNPLLYIGYTVRYYNADKSFMRRSFIVRLRDRASKLVGDAGYYHVNPDQVSSYLIGRNSSREVVKKRQPNENIWGEKIVTKWDHKQLVTTYGTYYDMRFLTKGFYRG